MSKIIPIILLFLLVASCKKEAPLNEPTFEHSEDSILVPCSCCEYSDIYEGVYEGHFVETEYVGYWGGMAHYNNTTDTTFLFNITKVWQDQNFIEDSLICKFLIPDFFSGPISITENSGYFSPSVYSNQKFENDSTLTLKNYTYQSEFDDSFISSQLNAVKQ
jgi:hypothetical protein